MSTELDEPDEPTPIEPYCVVGQLRMLARIVTGHYNNAFANDGVTLAQAGLLMHIFAKPGIRQAELSKLLQIEKSAMSRDVQLLQKRGWLTDNLRSGLFLVHYWPSDATKSGRC